FNAVLLAARIRASLDRKRMHDREVLHLEEIERQRQRGDELLHAMLPMPAVEELKTHDRVAPRRFDDVAVLFVDVIGFTGYCDRNPPEVVVANLHELAGTFEDLTAAYDLEKIKTVGDAFMATANLLDHHADPVMASLRTAFALADAAGSTQAGWQVRSGIHIGPVVAGVVGSRKFSFDIWGDTVNLSQRLSSLGNEPAVYLSAPAWQRVEGRAEGSPLGAIDLKGKSNVEVVRCLSIAS
ncbi:MAG: adenylate/guanylate cyclase domain-containing protein, partial [Pseudomonadota bacterium]